MIEGGVELLQNLLEKKQSLTQMHFSNVSPIKRTLLYVGESYIDVIEFQKE